MITGRLEALLPSIDAAEEAMEVAIEGTLKVIESILADNTLLQVAALRKMEDEIHNQVVGLIELRKKSAAVLQAYIQQEKKVTMATEKKLEEVISHEKNFLTIIQARHEWLRKILAKVASMYIQRREEVGLQTQAKVISLRDQLQELNATSEEGRRKAA